VRAHGHEHCIAALPAEVHLIRWHRLHALGGIGLEQGCEAPAVLFAGIKPFVFILARLCLISASEGQLLGQKAILPPYERTLHTPDYMGGQRDSSRCTLAPTMLSCACSVIGWASMATQQSADAYDGV
jgi:hypothetical protein